MMTDIQPTVIEIKPERCHELLTELFLNTRLKRPWRPENVRRAFLALQNGPKETRQKTFQIGE